MEDNYTMQKKSILRHYLITSIQCLLFMLSLLQRKYKKTEKFATEVPIKNVLHNSNELEQ